MSRNGKTKTQKRKTTQERDSLTGRYGADWLTPITRNMVDLIRTEIRRRHREAVYAECRDIEAKAKARLDDCINLGRVPEFETFEEIEAFCTLSRRELFKQFGTMPRKRAKGVRPYTKKELEGVTEYHGDGRR